MKQSFELNQDDLEKAIGIYIDLKQNLEVVKFTWITEAILDFRGETTGDHLVKVNVEVKQKS